MSGDQDVGNQAIVDSDGIVTDRRDRLDAVHERFRPVLVRCDDCDSFIAGNHSAIKDHFNSSHPSSKSCDDCKGKVFVYKTITKVKEKEISKEFVYHKCSHKEQPKTGASKTSTKTK